MIPEPLARAQACRESLLKLGFDDAQIKMAFGVDVENVPTPPAMHMVTIHLFVTDSAPPTGDFTITCGAIWRTWTPEICMLNWNRLPIAERERSYQKYQPLLGELGFLSLVQALIAKGIAIPRLPEVREEAAKHGVKLA